jgi:pimeloyl-ACP methyl ester carboxylesterase
MYGDRDIVVNPQQWQPLQAGVPHARIERFPTAGHFIMLDEPEEFRRCLLDFLENG